MTQFPSLLEDQISQIPALQLLQNLGYVYLRPQEVFLERKGKLSNVLLEGILEKQLRQLNRITFKGQLHEFSDTNIQAAIEALKDLPFDGLIRTNEKIYDLISLGKSLEQTIGGDTKSFTLNYIDWKNPENNVFHVVEEFEVERAGSHQTCRPDIMLFVNGIPFVVIECKRPDEKDSLNVAISQQLRNQNSEYIPRLFLYSQLLLAVNKNEAKYATTGTRKEFWSHWKERSDITKEISRLINKPLTREQKDKLFADRFAYVREYFDELEIEERLVTEQDRTIYSLCRPERLIELAHQFIVFDAGEKKIARYQQYFAIKNTLTRIKYVSPDGRRTGGVIWHTQGSGKSLTMVMMAKAIALDTAITDPRIVLVTDRIDLDDQIWGTFHSCGKEPVQARTGRHLLDMLARNKEAIITTVIDKFETAIKTHGYQNLSNNIFVLVDESHRSQYGEANAKMQKLLPHACYIGFTGTPLKKKDKNTAAKFGGIIDAYTIDQAVKDKAVVPLLYEGRHILQEVDQKAIDTWFERVTKPLSAEQRSDLKRKMSSNQQLNKADQKIYLTAWDISEHFRKNWQGTTFKAQLTADSKLSALKFKKYLDEFGQVSCEVLISGPDTREGNEAFERVGEEEVQAFWKQMMEKYSSEKEYNRSLINAFKHGDRPEIIIVVDKLLTGFDAPRNTVLYIARSLKEHSLLQAIARVNRLYEGKDFGYIIDYYGVLGELSEALDAYSSLSEFDNDDLIGALTDINEEIAKLPQRHSELWDVFKEIKNRKDEEAFEQLLADEARRESFYARLSAFNRTMSVAFSSVKFINETPEELVERYKRDLADFQRLRVSVKRRYAEEIDFGQYEAKVQKLINTHVTSSEILQITPQVNIFDREKFQAEVDKLLSAASKADTIAHRTKKTIVEKMDEDPFFYRRFSKILEDVIQAWREKRISDAEYLNKVIEIMNAVRDRTGDDLPEELQNHDVAKAFYGVINDIFSRWKDSLPNARMVSAKAALKVDRIIQENIVVDWISNQDMQNQMKNQIEDYLYAVKEMYGIDLSLDDMDLILDKSIEIAKTRYAQ
ncbi:MAG: HsdR family type I site-specific deoxyribonuclease [Acidobacteria bacterium]|nr:HsdR family type I site-specific deoxyribonuclease [Acidobacteriota bacterium]